MGNGSFSSVGSGQTDIYVVDADGSDESLVITDGEEPGFSPDGTRIVFRRDPADPNQGMNTVNLDGTGLQRIFVRGQDPAWSPDGSKIAIQETCCGGPGIATINSDGSGGELLLDGGPQAGHDHPNWSPDGTTVVYEREFPEPSGVYTVPRSGGTPSFLEGGFQPAWSPDGSKMVFEGAGELYVMNADGTAPVQIPNAAGINNHPDWQPLRALDPFPRPGGGTPLITYLVPAYEQCTSPNSQHVAPLAEGSCTPPLQVSDLLTTSKIGQGKGFVRLDVMPGNPATARRRGRRQDRGRTSPTCETPPTSPTTRARCLSHRCFASPTAPRASAASRRPCRTSASTCRSHAPRPLPPPAARTARS